MMLSHFHIRSRFVRSAAAAACSMHLVGCTIYQEKPLDYGTSLPTSLSGVVIDKEVMPLPELRSHVFDPSDGLDMTEVAMLAVVNNPALRLARDDAGVARAQAFAAGLLPDPQISLSRDFPFNGATASTAYSLGLSYAINTLLTYSTNKAAARADLDKADLNVLWQEWQTVAKARTLFVRLTKEDAVMHVLLEN